MRSSPATSANLLVLRKHHAWNVIATFAVKSELEILNRKKTRNLVNSLVVLLGEVWFFTSWWCLRPRPLSSPECEGSLAVSALTGKWLWSYFSLFRYSGHRRDDLMTKRIATFVVETQLGILNGEKWIQSPVILEELHSHLRSSSKCLQIRGAPLSLHGQPLTRQLHSPRIDTWVFVQKESKIKSQAVEVSQWRVSPIAGFANQF